MRASPASSRNPAPARAHAEPARQHDDRPDKAGGAEDRPEHAQRLGPQQRFQTRKHGRQQGRVTIAVELRRRLRPVRIVVQRLRRPHIEIDVRVGLEVERACVRVGRVGYPGLGCRPRADQAQQASQTGNQNSRRTRVRDFAERNTCDESAYGQHSCSSRRPRGGRSQRREQQPRRIADAAGAGPRPMLGQLTDGPRMSCQAP